MIFSRIKTLYLSAVLGLLLISACVDKNNKENEVNNAATIKSDGLAQTPPMGWNSWNAFGKEVSEEVIKQTADVMVSSGLKDLGYEYIVMDDFWHGGRDSVSGLLYEDAKRFPSGIKALADYVHSKGLKLGIYSDAGTQTCGGMPGSYGFEEKDAKLFAEWGIDYLKYDYCYVPELVSRNNDYKMAIDRYKKMGDALKSTGRQILFSICEWGPRSPWLWGKEVGGHIWRTSYDVADIWETPNNETSPIGILTSIDAAANLSRFAAPGGWNDLDMLVVGLNNNGYIKGGGCTDEEYQTQVSMWSMLASPIMLGGDIRNMSVFTKKILMNKDIININQDSLGKPAYRVFNKDGIDVYKRPLSGNRVAIAVLNRNSNLTSVNLTAKELGLEKEGNFMAYDAWEHGEVAVPKGIIAANIKSHECKVYVLSFK